MRVGVIILQGEILVIKGEDILLLWVYQHLWQLARFPCQLQFYLLQVIRVDMRVAQRVDEVTRLEARHLRHHLEEQGVGGDVERNAQEDIRAALVELEA